MGFEDGMTSCIVKLDVTTDSLTGINVYVLPDVVLPSAYT